MKSREMDLIDFVTAAYNNNLDGVKEYLQQIKPISANPDEKELSRFISPLAAVASGAFEKGYSDVVNAIKSFLVPDRKEDEDSDEETNEALALIFALLSSLTANENVATVQTILDIFGVRSPISSGYVTYDKMAGDMSIRRFYQAQFDFNHQKNVFMDAVSKGNLAIAQNYIRTHKPEMFSTEQSKRAQEIFTNALGIAAANGHELIVKALVNAGVDPNVCDSQNKPALIEATIRGRINVINYLLSVPGIKVDIVAPGNDTTPLMYAASAGNPAIIRALLNAGANVNFARNNGETALIRAIEKCETPDHVECVKILGLFGASQHARHNATLFAKRLNNQSTNSEKDKLRKNF